MTLTARARKQRFLRSSDFESLSRYEPHPRSRISALSLRFAPRGSKKRAYRYESSVWAPFASCPLNVLPSGRTRTIHERKSSNLSPQVRIRNTDSNSALRGRRSHRADFCISSESRACGVRARRDLAYPQKVVAAAGSPRMSLDHRWTRKQPRKRVFGAFTGCLWTFLEVPGRVKSQS